MAMEGQPDKMEPDKEVQLSQRVIIEFLHVEKTASIDIHQYLLSIYGNWTVDVCKMM